MKKIKVGYGLRMNSREISLFCKSYLDDYETNLNEDISKAGLYVFTDGFFHVSPTIYGDEKIDALQTDDLLDRMSFEKIKSCLEGKVPMIAFGRSAHLCSVVAGGSVIQKVKGHMKLTEGSLNRTDTSFTHKMTTQLAGDLEGVPSYHTSMMYPFLLPRKEYSVLGWAVSLSKESGLKDGKGDDIPVYNNKNFSLFPPTEIAYFSGEKEDYKDDSQLMEPEIVYYRNLNALCFDFDPSAIHDNNTELKNYIKQIVDLFLKNKL